ncbi:hypothetical protein [Spongorhabdus nitratireducens]
MSFDFIFMLTRDDRTVADAEQHVLTALECGVKHIGFKDIGVPSATLRKLNRQIKAAGATSYLEVVSLDRDSELASASTAVDIGVDYLLGGTRAEDVIPVIKETGIHYCPFPGTIIGHPSELHGSIEDIRNSTEALAGFDEVYGLDLLAYRALPDTDIPLLMNTVAAATRKPIIIAGSIETPEQIQSVYDSGAAAFTIGTAVMNGCYPVAASNIKGQLAAVLNTVSGLLQV